MVSLSLQYGRADPTYFTGSGVIKNSDNLSQVESLWTTSTDETMMCDENHYKRNKEMEPAEAKPSTKTEKTKTKLKTTEQGSLLLVISV